MKLLDYLGHVVRVKTKSGVTYVGYVLQHHSPEESNSGKEEIVIESPVVEIPEDEIEKIDNIEKNRPKKLTLLSIEEIIDELDVSYETAIKEIDALKHTEYDIDDTTMYDIDTAFKVAANLGKMLVFDWYCDNCNAYLNDQDGFERNDGKWVCKKCGHENIISKEHIKGL